MDVARAKELLRADRQRTNELLVDMAGRDQADHEAANQPGDMFDSAPYLVHPLRRMRRWRSARSPSRTGRARATRPLIKLLVPGSRPWIDTTRPLPLLLSTKS